MSEGKKVRTLLVLTVLVPKQENVRTENVRKEFVVTVWVGKTGKCQNGKSQNGIGPNSPSWKIENVRMENVRMQLVLTVWIEKQENVKTEFVLTVTFSCFSPHLLGPIHFWHAHIRPMHACWMAVLAAIQHDLRLKFAHCEQPSADTELSTVTVWLS